MNLEITNKLLMRPLILVTVLLSLFMFSRMWKQYCVMRVTIAALSSGLNSTQLDQKMQNILNININMPDMPNY